MRAADVRYGSPAQNPRSALLEPEPEPVLAQWRAARVENGLGINGPIHDLREIVDAILYVNRVERVRGAQERLSPLRNG